MITKFIVRLFGLLGSWPHWRVIVWLALIAEFVGLFAALGAIEHHDNLGEWLYLEFTALFGMLVGIVLAYFFSPRKFRNWHRRQLEHGLKTDPWMGLVAGVAFVIAGLTVVLFLLFGLDRQGVISFPFFHQGSAVERKNPLICVNEKQSLGLAAPYPEVLNTPTTEISSIGVCPFPLDGHSLKIQGLRINGNEYLGRDLDWVGFDPPMHLKPGEEIEVVVIGRDPYYNLPDSPTYVIKRYLPYSQEEIKSLLTRGADEPGYQKLDWERMEKEGLFYLDHSSDPNTRRVDAIYATYAGDSELDAWSARFPRGYEIVKIPFSFCVKPENDFILTGSMQNLPLWRRGILITIEKDGTVLVRNPEDRTILFVCANDYRPSTSN